MSEYKNIIGKGVRFLSSNLDNDQAEGQIWYNSTDNAFKNVLISEAWVSSGSMITAREAGGGAGTQTAGLYWAGHTPGATNKTEEYNGSGWASGGNYSVSTRNNSGTGTQTAALGFGGADGGAPTFLVDTYEYNGTSCSEGGDRANKINDAGGGGTQTAALGYGGYLVPPGGFSPPGFTNLTEEYDGSSWTSGGALSTARGALGGNAVGTQTAGICIGGRTDGTSGGITNTEEYDGSSWTSGGALGTGQRSHGAGGLQTSAISFGGSTPSAGRSTITQQYDGSSWTTSTATLGAANYELNGFGASSISALACGGNTGSQTGSTQEYNKSVNVITAAAWASGGSMNTSRSYASATSQGTQDATVVFGGNSPPNAQMANSESYNGSTWTATPALNVGRRMLGGAGTQTAGLAFGGFRDAPAGPPTDHQNITESWDGSSWTALPATMPIAQNLFASFGSQTAAVAAAGTLPAPTGNSTQLWNGSAWTTSPATVNTARFDLAGSGSQTSGLIFGGATPPASPPHTVSSSSESWNGSAWTSTPSLITARRAISGAGTQTATLAFGGQEPSNSSSTEGYDGTSWSTRPSLATARYTAVGSGTQTSALASGGGNPTATNATEEFTGETSALNIKTITTS